MAAEYTVEVIDRREIADRVIELTLRPVDGEVPRWKPGAHIDLILSSRLTRQYSLCGDPSVTDSLTIAVLREPGGGRGGSAYLHNMVHEGHRLRIRGPRNNFPLCEAERYLFIAGGIGITPLLPMIREVDARGAQWSLVYGGRTRASMAYRRELGELAAQSAHGTIDVCPQDETGLLDLDQLLQRPAGSARTADPQTAAREFGIPGSAVYCCGPESLLSAVEKHCAAWPLGTLHVERFAAAPPDPSMWVDTEFEVYCAQADVTVRVPPGTSILAVLDEVGVVAEASCWEGICGMCQTRVLDGVPEHRDHVLTPQERLDGHSMMLCCSRTRSPRLVVDL